jgi:retron-type reverse transcriptase
VDLQSFSDTMEHDLLSTLLEKRIEDCRFSTLINARRKAGSMADGPFHNASRGRPHGGIVSPLLAKGDLHELDRDREPVQDAVDTGKRRRGHPAYHRLRHPIDHLRRTSSGMQENGRRESPRLQERKRQLNARASRSNVLPRVNR